MDNLERISEVLSRKEHWTNGIRQIKIKEECYAFYEEGFFGNKPLTWNSYEKILESGWKGNVCMRSKRGHGVDRRQTTYNIPIEKVPDEIKKWEAKGFPRESITFNQSMPDDHLLIQGEYTDWTWSGFIDIPLDSKVNIKPQDKHLWYLRQPALLYTTIKKPMNLALAEQTLRAWGLNATFLLKMNMSESSYADLQELINMFPKSTIEFSAYDISVGNIPGRNTIIWEVRDY